MVNINAGYADCPATVRKAPAAVSSGIRPKVVAMQIMSHQHRPCIRDCVIARFRE
jgi:hypothetical protein